MTVHHVQLVGWSGIKNGELLTLAASYWYDALISADKNMSYKQNEEQLPITVVVLEVLKLRMEDLIPLLPIAVKEVSNANGPKFIKIKQ